MLKFKPHAFQFTILLAFVLVIFQNCGDGFNATITSSSGVDFGNQTELIYGHNGHLQFQEASTEAQPVYSNRMLTYNIFVSVFGESLKPKMVDMIAWAASDVGSGWDLYQKRRVSNASCNSSKSPHYRCDNVAMVGTFVNISGASAPREGRRMTICELGINDDPSLLHALNKIDKSSSLEALPEANRTNFESAFQLFFRGKHLPDNDFFDALTLVYNNHYDKKEAWKQIILGICLSPHWQVL